MWLSMSLGDQIHGRVLLGFELLGVGIVCFYPGCFLSDHVEVWKFDWGRINLGSFDWGEWKSFRYLFIMLLL